MATTWKQVQKKMEKMGITGGQDWENLTPSEHMVTLRQLERLRKRRAKPHKEASKKKK